MSSRISRSLHIRSASVLAVAFAATPLLGQVAVHAQSVDVPLTEYGITTTANGSRPATLQMKLQGEALTTISSTSGDLGGVAQNGVAAAIYRSTGCGFQSWIPGQPAWLDELVFFNEDGDGAPLRSMNFPMCYDTCHRGGNCPTPHGGSCDCLAPGDFPIVSTFQLYDGDPCGDGVQIAGAGGSVIITEEDIPNDQIRDGRSNCFNLTVTIDSKVQVPHRVWVEANYGHDDAWPLTGRPNDLEGQGNSPLSGLNDGIDCITFCDIGDPNLCSNNSNRCDWITANVDTNADIVFRLQPVGSLNGGGMIVNNEIVLAKGSDRVFLDIMVSDFDPIGLGTRITAWQSGIDSSGYTSALQGTLTVPRVACTSTEDCVVEFGPTGICRNSPLGMFCDPALRDFQRPDYLFFDAGPSIDGCGAPPLNYACASTLLGDGNISSPGRESYLWTAALDVSPNAKGTFTVDLALPNGSALVDINDKPLPRIGIVPALITVTKGRCCLLFGNVCLDDLIANECTASGGDFTAGVDCTNICPTTGACCNAMAPGGVCTDGVEESACTGTNESWSGKTSCNSIACEEVTGACCVSTICTNDVALSQCSVSGNGQLKWANGTTCDDPVIAEPCANQAQIPTVSTWGLLVLGLLLLIGAKIGFRRSAFVATHAHHKSPPAMGIALALLLGGSAMGQVRTSTPSRDEKPIIARSDTRMLIGNEPLTELIGYANGALVGSVAQSSVPAAIFRSQSCGFQGWVPGTLSYLHQMIFFNNKPLTPLRSYSVPVCFDTCHRGNRCVGQGGPEDCDCLAADDFPLSAVFQIYDGDPCGEGMPIAGTQVTIPITAADIPPETIGDGTSKCFEVTAVVDPKVEVPEDVWLEANVGHDDAWPMFGRPNFLDDQGDGGLAGFDDGVECTTFCYKGDSSRCSASGTCLSVIPSVDANADVIFSLQPVPPPAGTKHAETFTYRIVGNEAILARGGEPVFFEIRVNDFDPKKEGIVARAWQVEIDSSGYFSALRGTLTPSLPECVDSGIDCATQNGPGSLCNVSGEAVPNVCTAGFFDLQRIDYIFLGQSQAAGVNRSSLDYIFGVATLSGSGTVSRPEGYYLASLVLRVSSNASGTFTIGLAEPPRTVLLDNSGQFVPLIGSVTGKVTIETGRCCVDFGDACFDDLTLNECEAQGGVLTVNQTCEVAPCPMTGACCDSLAPGGACVDGVAEGGCIGDHLTFAPRTTCAVVSCNEDTGACCVEGVCTNDIARSQCPNDTWFKALPCDDSSVADACEFKGRIPTVSTWGLLVLGLLLLIGAKIGFRRSASVATHAHHKSPPVMGIALALLLGGSAMGQVRTSIPPPDKTQPRNRFYRMPIGDEPLTELVGYADETTAGSVAQSSVPAAIFRSTACGFQLWRAGSPAWLDELILFNDGGIGAPLRQVSLPVCFDTCHRGNRCVGQGGPEDCDCLDSADLPFDATFQMYDNDPCGSGLLIPGAGGSITVTGDMIPEKEIGDGRSNCFNLNFVVDPKVHVPNTVWIEANYGIEDAWPLSGRPSYLEGQGNSTLSGINDGVNCTTFCDRGDPKFCKNDVDSCWEFRTDVDSNAQVVFSIQPVPPPIETKYAETFTYRIEGSEAILSKGGEPVFFEIRMSDFDPKQVGIRVGGWQVTIDSDGYSGGIQGVLTPFRPNCSGLDCMTQNGLGSVCDEPMPNLCMAGYTDFTREDYLFLEQSQGTSVNRESLDYIFGDTLTAEGGVLSTRSEYYLASLVLEVSPHAKGTFTVDLMLPPFTFLLNGDNQVLPLIGVTGAKITIATGHCCMDFGNFCIDTLKENECLAYGGVFVLNGSCEENPCQTFGACCNRLVPGGSCTANVTESDCIGDHLTFAPRTTCAVVSCNEDTGACCVEGVCTNDIARSQCPNDTWFKGLPCDDSSVADACEFKGRIPTVSTWGLLVLGLLLLIGAKIGFRRSASVATHAHHKSPPAMGIALALLLGGSAVGQVRTSTPSHDEKPIIARSDTRMLIGNEPLTELFGYANGAMVGSVAQSSVPAAIFRSTACGFLFWNPGSSYLRNMILFNNKSETPLRSYGLPVCFDTCHRSNNCVGQGGSEDCNCLEQFSFLYAGSMAIARPSRNENSRRFKPAARNTEQGNALTAGSAPAATNPRPLGSYTRRQHCRATPPVDRMFTLPRYDGYA